MAGQNRTALALVICGAVLAGYGFIETQREVGPYLNAGVRDEQRFGAIVAGNYLPAASSMSKDLVLSDCLMVPQTLYARVQPPTRQAEFAQRCLAIAQSVVAEVPTQSAAWLVIASASAALGDSAGLNSALVSSQRVGADVHWLGEQRLGLAAQHLDLLDAPARDVYRRDLLGLFDSDGGVKVLAAHYVANPAEQETILGVAETVPSARQERFLASVRDLKTGQAAR